MKSKGLGRGLSALLPDAEEEKTLDGAQSVAIREIKPNPQQPRRDFNRDDLDDLAASIKEKGVIQPLIVRNVKSGYELIAGERRLRASKLAGLREIPVRIIEASTDVELLELSLIENLQRDDLNAIELAEGYRKLAEEFSLTQEKIAKRVGKERATVANMLRLLDLPSQIRESLRKGEISAGHAKAIRSVKGPARQSAVWKRIVKDSLSVRQTEDIIRGSSSGGRRKSKRRSRVDPPEFQQAGDKIRRALATQVHIHKKGKKGEIRIEFYSEEDLNRLVDLLLKRDKKW